MTEAKLFGRRFTPVGAAPGTLVVPDDSVAPKIHAFVYDEAGLVEHDPSSAAEAHALLASQKVVWIDVQGLGDAALVSSFGQLFNFHRLAMSDVVHIGQRPKIDTYGRVLYAVLRMATVDADGDLHWEQISLFLGERFVLTFQERPGDCLDSLRQRMRAGGNTVRRSQSDYLAIQVMDSIVDGYFPILEQYGEILEDLEDRVIGSADREILAEIYAVRRELMSFRRAAWPLRDALNQLARGEYPQIGAESLLYLRDTTDHVMQVVEVLENYRELAGSLVDVHLSEVSNRTNDIMRVLTVISTIFIPLTFLAGIYGMNFDTSSRFNMPELGWRYGYVMFWVVCLTVGTALLILFRRLGWLGGRP